MRTQLVVEENIVDLTSELEAQLTFSVDDIADFAKNNSNYSKTIVIPGTAQNNFIFGHIFDINIYNTHNPASQNVGYNYNAAKSARAEVYKDYMLLFKGVVRVLQITINKGFIEYEVALTGELGGLISALENKRLEDLDFSAYDQAVTSANISASWSAATGEGVYFPLIDYGGISTNKIDYDFKAFRPALHVKEYIDKIFEAAGYTYESAFLNASFFKKLIVPNNFSNYWEDPGQCFLVYTSPDDILTNNTIDYPLQAAFLYEKILKWGTPTTNLFSFNTTTGKLTFNRSEPASMDFQVRLYIESTHSLAAGTVYCNSYIYVNDVRVFTARSGTILTGVPLQFDYNCTLQIPANAVIYVTAEWDTSGQNGTNVTLFKVSSNAPLSKWEISSNKVLVGYGNTLSINDFIPKNIYQKDFLSWIGKMFRLMYYEDRDKNKHLKIEPWINFYDTDLDNAFDWTHKQDFMASIKLKPLGEMNSKIYEWKYKDDSDYYNDVYKKKFGETYGSFLFDTGYEFVKDKNTVEVGFSPTPMVQYAGTDKVTSAMYKLNNTTEELNPQNIRVLIRSSAPISCGNWKIKDGSTDLSTYSNYGYAGHLDDPETPTLDINFGSPQQLFFTVDGGYLSANLYNVYWSAYLGEIIDKDSKLLTGKFRLLAADIQNLDFTKFIFIGGQLFRLNKVEDYNTVDEETTTCELINVINVI